LSVADNFLAFRNAYMITQEVTGSISYRYKRLTRQLNSTFWNTDSESSHSRYIGSYGRDTAARGVSDIDVYFQLPVSVYQQYNGYLVNGQSALLQAVRNSIGNTYPTTSLRGDGQVVVIPFTDSITFELLPGFANKDGSITFPDANGGGCWRTCNPTAEMNAFAARNTEANHNLKAIGRMARVWKEQNGVNMNGMLIDTLAYNFIDTWAYKDKSYMYHDYLVRDFFLYLSRIDSAQERWSAPGSGSWVRRTGGFERKAKAAYDAAVEATRQETAGYMWASRQSWQLIFGTLYNG
jgi:hypothetical protein